MFMLDHATLLDLGAKAHIAALAQQIADVVTQLPNLKGYASKTIRDALGVEPRVNGVDTGRIAAGLTAARKARATTPEPEPQKKPRKFTRRRPKTARERREISKRMSAYWAKRRAEKSDKVAPAPK
jgi:hypothetical protein